MIFCLSVVSEGVGGGVSGDDTPIETSFTEGVDPGFRVVDAQAASGFLTRAQMVCSSPNPPPQDEDGILRRGFANGRMSL